MDVRVRGPVAMILSRPGAPFFLSLLMVFSAVLTGLLLGRSVSGGAVVAAGKDDATSQVLVLQESGEWLSETYWQRRREKRQQRRDTRDTYDQSNLGVRINPFSDVDGRRNDRSHRGGGNYRTVCVRLCDGYYFPISFSTTEDRFDEDEQACQSKCSSDARLFYYRNSDGSPETMTDRNGKDYASLKAAFLYRTAYQKSCQCRPDPWSDAAKQQHAMYRGKDWEKRSKELAKLEAKRSRMAARQLRKRNRIVASDDWVGATPDSVAALQGVRVNAFDGQPLTNNNVPYANEVHVNRQESRRPRYGRSGRMGLGQSTTRTGRRGSSRASGSSSRKSSQSWKRSVFGVN